MVGAEIVGIIEEAGQRHADRRRDHEPEHPQVKPGSHNTPIDQLIKVDTGEPATQCNVSVMARPLRVTAASRHAAVITATSVAPSRTRSSRDPLLRVPKN